MPNIKDTKSINITSGTTMKHWYTDASGDKGHYGSVSLSYYETLCRTFFELVHDEQIDLCLSDQTSRQNKARLKLQTGLENYGSADLAPRTHRHPGKCYCTTYTSSNSFSKLL